jgi:hypothetical protein
MIRAVQDDHIVIKRRWKALEFTQFLNLAGKLKSKVRRSKRTVDSKAKLEMNANAEEPKTAAR